MKKASRPLNSDEIGFLIGLASTILGAGLYLYPPALAGFPVNDGGLFYTMIRAIQQDAYRLPEYVQYNGLSIPFAYPPLGFYVGALISSILGIDPLRVIQWFPAIVLIGTSVAFYFLAKRMLKSPIEAGIATFLYVCTPRSMTMLVMGGGLTRSLGQLFLILTTAFVLAMFTQRRPRFLILSIAFGALVVLTHPEASVHAVSACTLLWLLEGRSHRGTVDALIVAFAVAAASAIWWLPAVLQIGIAPFASAAQTGLHASILFVYPFMLTFTQEPAMTLIACLGLIGVAASVAQGKYLLPLWALLPFAVEPRDAATVAVIPLALLGAVALHEVVFPGIHALQSRSPGSPDGNYLSSRTAWILGGYLALFLLVMGIYAASLLAQLQVSKANRVAFEWVSSNTPPESRFLILTGEIEPFCDPLQEWFPVLSQRISSTTIQGYEWASNGAFFARIGDLQEMQRCLSQDSPLQCVKNVASAMGVAYDYIYVPKRAQTTQMCRPTGQTTVSSALSMDLGQDSAFQRVYQTIDVEIFAAPR